MGYKIDTSQLFSTMFNKALEADPDGGGLLSYGYYSGEFITGLDDGRNYLYDYPSSKFNLRIS